MANERSWKAKPFDARKNKTPPPGSVWVEYETYREIYGTNQLHPIRRELLDRKAAYTEQIEYRIKQFKHPIKHK